MKPGRVRAVRELAAGVQGSVLLGGDLKLGFAEITVVCHSPSVLKALETLKQEIATEARTYVADVLKGQFEWDTEYANRTAGRRQ